MHPAPPVTYPVGRSRTAAAVALVAGSAGLAATLSWAFAGADSGPRLLAVLGALALAAGALRQCVKAAAGNLAWDGSAWQWPPRGEAPGQLTVCLDFQRVMLLRWQPENAPVAWLWLERSRLPQRWNDLRRAVYSPTGTHPRLGAEPPAAKP